MLISFEWEWKIHLKMTLRKVFNCEFFEKLLVKYIREWHYRSGRWLGNALSFHCLHWLSFCIDYHVDDDICSLLYIVQCTCTCIFYLRIMWFMYMHTNYVSLNAYLNISNNTKSIYVTLTLYKVWFHWKNDSMMLMG